MKIKIAVVGTGYVGLVSGTCFAEMGTSVACIDVDKEKIDGLNRGVIPIYEPGLEQLVEKNVKAKRLTFHTNLLEVIDNVDIIFSAVGTPPLDDGSADLHFVLDVARTIGKHMNKYLLIVTKSTVPVGTAKKVENIIREELDRRGVSVPFDVASNPEFLKEGEAINDFMRPDRIVIGVKSSMAKTLMEKLYRPFTLNGHPLIFMDIPSAEMTKYAANAMLATRISFMNEIANLCEHVGANYNHVRQGIGSDPRIGNRFLYAGIGYGGSCFPKDVRALIKTGAEHGVNMRVINAVEEVNKTQKLILFDKVKAYFETQCESSLKGKIIAVWGLAFKPETNDTRESPSIAIINAFLDAGCHIRVYDPVAMPEAKLHYLGNKVFYASNKYEATEGADALLLTTEWKEFRVFDIVQLKNTLKNPLIFDGRNIYDAQELHEEGFTYFSIGRKETNRP